MENNTKPDNVTKPVIFDRKKIYHAGFLSTFWLKIIAIICMTVDHAGLCLGLVYKNESYYLSGFMSYDTYSLMRTMGRLAFPIFCYLIVEGLFYTHDVFLYTLRLFIFAGLSQIPFSLMTKREAFAFEQNLNVYFTLAFGLITIAAIEYFKKLEKKKTINTPIFVLLSAVVIICSTSFADTINTDYAGYGVVVIVIFYVFKDKPLFIAGALAIATHIMSSGIEMYALLAMVPIVLHNHQKGPSLKYIFYMYYPVHMLILYFISTGI